MTTKGMSGRRGISFPHDEIPYPAPIILTCLKCEANYTVEEIVEECPVCSSKLVRSLTGPLRETGEG